MFSYILLFVNIPTLSTMIMIKRAIPTRMWAEMEAVMRKKYDIPEISIYRFLKPERREQIKPQDRHNRPYTKKDTEYWAKFERKKTD